MTSKRKSYKKPDNPVTEARPVSMPFKVMFGSCCVFLLIACIYFFLTGGYTEANFSARGIKKGSRLDAYAILYLFCCMTTMYILALRPGRKTDKTRYRK